VLMWLLVGVGVLFVVTTAGAERRGRQHFAEQDDAFLCRVRACGSSPRSWRSLRRRWSRPMWAVWDREMLEIRRGPVADRTVRLAVVVSPSGVHGLPWGDVTGCGWRAVAVQLWGADGSVLELIAPDEARADLVGPYLAAAITDLPRAPLPRRNW
jgi:hypothetical protein